MARKAMTRSEARFIAQVQAASWARSDAHDGLDGLGLRKADVPLVRREMIEIAVELFERAGVRACRYCACTEDAACDDGTGAGCAWVAKNVCSAPACLRAWKGTTDLEAALAGKRKGARRGR